LKKLIIFDLDGVIYVGDEILPHAPETLKTLRGRGLLVRFLTNNSTKSRKSYVEKLGRMGIEAREEEIVSSSYLARVRLDALTGGRARVFIVGERGIADELDGYTILGPAERESADYVIVGYDSEFNYEKMSHALDALLAGAEMIATNRDPTFPQPGGKILPGGGSIVAAVAAAWQREPFTCGKPNPFGIRHLMERSGAGGEETLLVGDRADSDMLTGYNAGVDTCLVLTGITRREELDSLPPEQKPTYTIDDLGELPGLLERLAGGNSIQNRG